MRNDAFGSEPAELGRSAGDPRRRFEGAEGPLANANRCSRPTKGTTCGGADHENLVTLSFELLSLGLDEVPRRVAVVGGVARRDDGDTHRKSGPFYAETAPDVVGLSDVRPVRGKSKGASST